MFEQFNYLVLPIITTLILLIILVLLFMIKVIKSDVKLIKKNSASNEVLIDQLQGLFIDLEKSVKQSVLNLRDKNTELEQVSKQLELRIKNLQGQLSTFEKIQEQQPEDKLYSRAFKLVELGAPIEEIIKECDIPRAEAEMLVSIHKKQSP